MTEVPVPFLDDLRFQELVDEAKRFVPVRAPAWTDHNVSDPGITLIEACAARVDQSRTGSTWFPIRSGTGCCA